MAFFYFHGVTEIKAEAKSGDNNKHWVEFTIIEKEYCGQTSTQFTLFGDKSLCSRLADAINAAQNIKQEDAA